MRRRIKVNGVLYEQVSAGKRHHSRRLVEDVYNDLPDRIGHWELTHADSDSLFIYQLSDMSFLEVVFTYGYHGKGMLTAEVYFDSGYPEEVSNQVHATIPEDDVVKAVKIVLKELEKPMNSAGFPIENYIAEVAAENDLDFYSDEAVDEADGPELDRLFSKFHSKVNPAIRKLNNTLK